MRTKLCWMQGQGIGGEGLEDEMLPRGLVAVTSQRYPVPRYKWLDRIPLSLDSFGLGKDPLCRDVLLSSGRLL